MTLRLGAHLGRKGFLFVHQLSPLLLFLVRPVPFFGTKIACSFTVVPVFPRSGGVEFVLELLDRATGLAGKAAQVPRQGRGLAWPEDHHH